MYLVHIFFLHFSVDKVVYDVSLLAHKCSKKLWQLQTVTFDLIITTRNKLKIKSICCIRFFFFKRQIFDVKLKRTLMQMKNLSNPIFSAIISLNKPKNYEQLIPNQPYCKSEGLFRFQHTNLSLIRS